MGVIDGIIGWPSKPRLASVGTAIVGRLARFVDRAGRVAASLVSVDEDGNLSTPGSLTAGADGAASVGQEWNGGESATFGFAGLAAGYKAIRQFATGETGVISKQTLTLVGDADNADPTYTYLADGMQVFRGSAAGETQQACAVLQVGAGAGKYGGFLPPRVTTTNRDAIPSPQAGLIVYNTTAGRLEAYIGGAWVGLSTTP